MQELIKHNYTTELIASIKEHIKTKKQDYYPYSDFMARPCYGLTIENLSKKALQRLREKYLKTTKNTNINNFTDEELLSDLDLLRENKLNYGALVLLGKREIIKDYLPQARVTIEYRKNETTEDRGREEIREPLILLSNKIIEKLEPKIGTHKFISGLSRIEIRDFEKEVLREALLNALIHREYQNRADVRIKLYPERMEIINPGGFPEGVTAQNIITINSTPRSYILSNVLKKAGYIEEAGQGVDRIFELVLANGKKIPDYSMSHQTQVWLTIHAKVDDEGFALFIEAEQEKRVKNNNEKYYELSKKTSEIAGFAIQDIREIADLFDKEKIVKMGDFKKVFENKKSKGAIKYIIDQLVDKSILIKKGKNKGTIYKINKKGYKESNSYTIIKKHLTKNKSNS